MKRFEIMEDAPELAKYLKAGTLADASDFAELLINGKPKDSDKAEFWERFWLDNCYDRIQWMVREFSAEKWADGTALDLERQDLDVAMAYIIAKGFGFLMLEHSSGHFDLVRRMVGLQAVRPFLKISSDAEVEDRKREWNCFVMDVLTYIENRLNDM